MRYQRLCAIRLLFVCFLLVCFPRAADSRAADNVGEVLQPLVDQHAGKVAVAIRILDAHNNVNMSWDYQATEVMPTASLIKLPIMIEAYRQMHERLVAPEDSIVLTDEDKVPGSGVLTEHFSAGSTIRLRDAIRLMIRYSDNTATNLILDRIGLSTTSQLMRDLGFPETQLHSKVYRRDTSLDLERSKRYGLGSTRAVDMVEMLMSIERRELISADACEEMLEHLLACDDTGRFPKLLPAQTRVAHKTGAVDRSRTAAGIIYGPGCKIVLCVLTDANADTSWSNDNEAHLLCANLAKAAFDFVSRDSSAETSGELRVGAHGELVEALQRTLNARIQSDLSVDGDFGTMTEAAVKRFQASVELPETGSVDSPTWKALGDLVPESAEQLAAPDVINSQSLPLSSALDPYAPPEVTAKSYVVLDGRDGSILAEKSCEQSLPNASTTKLMTAYLILELAHTQPSVLDEIVTFSKRADETIGSTAGVRGGEQLPVHELLYGLLLPSGNDASVALAEHFGNRLGSGAQAKANEAPADRSGAAAAYDCFILAMNRKAEELRLNATHFVNPHGLTADGHHSSALDLGRLALRAFEVPRLRDYVSCRQRSCRVTSRDGYSRTVIWKNTNQLLSQQGFSGVKTGTTDAAGACLIAYGEQAEQSRVVVVLGASSSDARYVDARNLFAWSWREAMLAP